MNKPISCNYRIGAYSVLPPHWQGRNLCLPDSKFYFVQEGEIVVEIADQRIVAGPNDLLLIPARTVHSCYLTESNYAAKSWCHFELKYDNRDFFEHYSIPVKIHIADDPTVGRLFRDLFATSRLSPPHCDLIASAILAQLVQYYFEHADVRKRIPAEDRIHLAIRYIEEHYADPLTLHQLASLVGYSPGHFSSSFKRATGYPPMRYLNNVRINHAKNLLQFTSESVTSILEKTGFTDATYFSKYFKQCIGYSPLKFRMLCSDKNK